MKNIVLVNTEEVWGGGEHWFYEVAVALQRENQVSVWMVVHPNGELVKRLKKSNIKVEILPWKIALLDLLNPIKQKRWLEFFESNRIDCVLYSTPTEAKIIGQAARWAGVERRILRRGIPLPVRDSRLNLWLLKKNVTHLLTDSYWTAQLLGKSRCVAQLPLKVIHNGVWKANLNLSPLFREQPPLKIGSLGRLSPEKGHKDLVILAEYLIKRGIDIEVHLAGEGVERRTLEDLIRKKGLEKNIFLHGFVSHPVHFLQEMDLLVHTARWEGFGFALIEAMAQGRPVVAYDAGSTHEIIEHGKNGYIVPMGNIQQLAEVVCQLQNPQHRRTLGLAAIERIKQHFLWEDKLQEIIHYLLFG